MVPRGEGSEAAVTQTENTNKAKKISPEKVTLHGGEEWNRTERRGEEWKNREGQNRGGGPRARRPGRHPAAGQNAAQWGAREAAGGEICLSEAGTGDPTPRVLGRQEHKETLALHIKIVEALATPAF